MKIIEIGSSRRLFGNYELVDDATNIELVAMEAERDRKIVEGDKPWEPYGVILPVTVQYNGTYFLYYTAPQMEYFANNRNVMEKRYTCVAISEDGQSWRKPEVGIFEVCGTRKNNVVMPACLGSVFVDPNKTNGAPYWWIGNGAESTVWPETAGMCYTGGSNPEGGVYLFSSKDGIHWTRAQKEPVLPFWCDTLNQCFFDEDLGKYVAYIRGWHEKYGRVICRCETVSLTENRWEYVIEHDRGTGPNGLFGAVRSELPIVMHTDENDPPDSDLYTPLVHKYPWAGRAYVAFPPLYRHYPYVEDENGNSNSELSSSNLTNRPSWQQGVALSDRDERGSVRNDGPVQSELAFSSDGKYWKRFRVPYLRQGFIGEQDGGGDIRMGLGLIRDGKRIIQHYMAKGYPHKFRDIPPFSAIYRCRQRLDGFVAARTDTSGGELMTPPLKFRGGRLTLNIDCGARGEAWVELRDKTGDPIPGYTFDECISIDRNDTDQKVWWKNGPDLSRLQDCPVRLCIRMRSADLYALQFR